MAQKGITKYTPPSAAPHIYAEDDAQVHRALIGSSGITLADNMLACSIVNNNTVRMASGMYAMQGYMISVQAGTSEDLTVDSGSVGSYRHDLIIAEFVRGGGNEPDTFVFRVLKGENASTAATASDPDLIQEDLTVGGSQRQEALFRIIIEGSVITGISRIANYIGNVYQ